ncbi:DsbA family protein [Limibaculum sp. M0105]|uniref:DsbA family protein n=1 Tax=Thermohalobaculum xanthum TaxID=2753746 RepID=A0A8J7MB27_9RHOB|nr:DsbA family protein [Thermohalobaculum xanthum]MBK0401013.1 DsbA family protein [Thermohalobaculum xanthum]
MPHRPSRRDVMTAATASMLVLALPRAAAAEPYMEDVALGADDAPVTVIEYASFTCPHCAAFHVNTWPEIKKAYVDTGKVRFILREVYFDRYGLWASMVARCGGEAGFYPMADQFLKKQDQWSRSQDIAAEIQKIGRLNGLSAEAINACLSDQDYAKALIERYQNFATADDVRSTPSFLINGEKHTGNLSAEEFSALLDKHL